jgi:two-component system cell cycle response regulator CpdR
LRSLLKASKDYPDIPILLMTGYAAERQRAHNLDALIHDVISKLFTVTQICEMVRRITNTAAQDETVH